MSPIGSSTTVRLGSEFVGSSVTSRRPCPRRKTASWASTSVPTAEAARSPSSTSASTAPAILRRRRPRRMPAAIRGRGQPAPATSNHAASSNSVDFAITKADAVVAINGYTGTYDGSPHGASGSVTGVAADPSAAGSSLDLGATFTSPPGGTASWTFHGGTNYKDQSGTAVIKITGIGGVRQNEGTGANSVFAFPIVLPTAPAGNQSFTVQYATGGGTADTSDYQAMSGILTFGPGVTLQYINVVVYGDFTPESNETFFVNLSNPRLYTNGVWAAATLPNTQAVGTIVDDDHTNLAVSMTSIRQAEGNSGTTLFTFAPTLSAAPASGQYFTVDYTTATAGSGTGYADGNDFTSKAGTLTFLAGSTTPSAPLTIAVTGDTKNEGDEIFNVVLSNPKLHPTGTAVPLDPRRHFRPRHRDRDDRQRRRADGERFDQQRDAGEEGIRHADDVHGDANRHDRGPDHDQLDDTDAHFAPGGLRSGDGQRLPGKRGNGDVHADGPDDGDDLDPDPRHVEDACEAAPVRCRPVDAADADSVLARHAPRRRHHHELTCDNLRGRLQVLAGFAGRIEILPIAHWTTRVGEARSSSSPIP